MFLARITRIIPLAAILFVVAFVIYVVAQIKYSPLRAKYIVINVFIWISCILSAIFLLACIYALLDKNQAVLELFASFAAIPLLGLIITLISKLIFIKKHPNFKNHASKTDKNESFKEFWAKRIQKSIKKYINSKFNRK